MSYYPEAGSHINNKFKVLFNLIKKSYNTQK